MNKQECRFKQEAHKLVDQLPDNATWHDLMFSAGERYDLEAAAKTSEEEENSAGGGYATVLSTIP